MSFYFTTCYNSDEIVDLRKIAFHLKFQDRVRLDGLNWNNTDAHSLHFSLRNNQKLLSTLRITSFQDKFKFEKATQIPMTSDFQAPYVLLARAATHPDFENSDLHAILRILALEYCLEKNIDAIFGSLQKKSKRLNHLLNQGYEIVSSISGWPDSYIQNDGDVALIVIQKKQNILNFIARERQRLNYHETQDFSNLQISFY
jgi:hypothetical protein